MQSFFPRGVLDEILNLIESVSEDIPSYSLRVKNNFKMYKNVEKRGGVNAKRAVEKQSKEFIKKEKEITGL